MAATDDGGAGGPVTNGHAPHRWSGWPGAWCLDCGAPDENEVCLATGCEHFPGPTVNGGDAPPCPIHVNGPCPEPGSKRHDPYSNATALEMLDDEASLRVALFRKGIDVAKLEREAQRPPLLLNPSQVALLKFFNLSEHLNRVGSKEVGNEVLGDRDLLVDLLMTLSKTQAALEHAHGRIERMREVMR